jgi:hypothetical protein
MLENQLLRRLLLIRSVIYIIYRPFYEQPSQELGLQHICSSILRSWMGLSSETVGLAKNEKAKFIIF